MRISLKEFLATGVLGVLQVGMTVMAVEQVLGPPEAEMGRRRRYRHTQSTVRRYGDVAFFKDRVATYAMRCIAISIEQRNDPTRFVFPSSWIVEDWDLRPGASRQEVERYLRQEGLAWNAAKPDGAVQEIMVVPSRVRMTFDEGHLWSIAASLD